MGDKAGDSGAAVFEVSRVQLMRWYHVEGLRGRTLQDKYRQECGVCAEASGLEQWLRAPAQRLAVLDTNSDIHGHGCEEYAFLELQKGRPAVEVSAELREKYLVEVTPQRLAAYRKYREQDGHY